MSSVVRLSHLRTSMLAGSPLTEISASQVSRSYLEVRFCWKRSLWTVPQSPCQRKSPLVRGFERDQRRGSIQTYNKDKQIPDDTHNLP